jgi:tRNA (cmo5U34)-methyltransferase
MATEWDFDPVSYLAMVRSEIPTYDQLQSDLARATATIGATRILDLGSGTGVTAQRVLAEHPGAELVGVDASDAMLTHARALVPAATFVVQPLESPLPDGPFDLVVSAFAIHHLGGSAKSQLFDRVARVLSPNGRFVYADVVIPSEPVEHPVPLEEGVDLPSTIAEQLEWLRRAGLSADVLVADGDLAVVAAHHEA